MSVFNTYEPHTEYIMAVTLTEDNFDDVADELSQTGYMVARNTRWGNPVSITLFGEGVQTPITCGVYECFVQAKGSPITVIQRHELRAQWRKVAADPYAG